MREVLRVTALTTIAASLGALAGCGSTTNATPAATTHAHQHAQLIKVTLSTGFDAKHKTATQTTTVIPTHTAP
jgi:hypothetical protein